MKNLLYFILSNEIDTKKIGNNPQITDTVNGLTEEINGYFSSFSKKEEIPNVVHFLDELKLDDDAKVTDFLSCSFIRFGFIINQKIKKIFEEYKDDTFNFYEAKVTHKKRVYDYFFFFKIGNINEIEYERSTFVKTNLIGSEIISELKINSYSEHKEIAFNTLNDERKLISFKEVVVKDDKDMFAIPISNKLYISKALKEKLEAQKVSGTTFNESKILFSKEE